MWKRKCQTEFYEDKLERLPEERNIESSECAGNRGGPHLGVLSWRSHWHLKGRDVGPRVCESKVQERGGAGQNVCASYDVREMAPGKSRGAEGGRGTGHHSGHRGASGVGSCRTMLLHAGVGSKAPEESGHPCHSLTWSGGRRAGREAARLPLVPSNSPTTNLKTLSIWNAENDSQCSDAYKGTAFCQVTLFDRNGP